MNSYKVDDVKSFMNTLLRQPLFDPWEFRELKLNTLVRYQISGELNSAFISEEEKESLSREYALWSEMKDTVFALIRGKKAPSLLALTLAFPRDQITEVPTDSIESFLLNIHFENNSLMLITATATRSFSMDRTAEQYWDRYIPQYFSANGIELTAES